MLQTGMNKGDVLLFRMKGIELMPKQSSCATPGENRRSRQRGEFKLH
jgi:hypothetical protein